MSEREAGMDEFQVKILAQEAASELISNCPSKQSHEDLKVEVKELRTNFKDFTDKIYGAVFTVLLLVIGEIVALIFVLARGAQ